MKLLCLSVFGFLVASCSAQHTGQRPELVERNLVATLASIQADFVNKKCVSCHEVASATNRYVKLTDLSKVIDGANDETGERLRKLIKPGCPHESFFYSIMKSGEMPPSPREKVMPEELQIIENWITNLESDTDGTCNDDEPPD